MRLSRSLGHPASAGDPGFSLTEVVLAMGVATIAFTSIIGLFPLGLDMSKESFEETQSSMIAQTILSDLKDQQVGSKNKRYDGKPKNPYSFKLIQIAGNVEPQTKNGATNYLGIDLTSLAAQNVYLAYDTKPRNDTDPTSSRLMVRPCAYSTNATPPDWYQNGSNGCFSMAKVTFCPTFTITTLANTSGVIRVDISLETPGSAKSKDRTIRMYTGAVVP